MEKLQAKGDLDEEELRALEEDVTGKIMLASWRGTRFEVTQVLREVRCRAIPWVPQADLTYSRRRLWTACSRTQPCRIKYSSIAQRCAPRRTICAIHLLTIGARVSC